jgi:hypothetical protein
MNGVTIGAVARGLPATAVLRLAGDRPVERRRTGSSAGDEALLAAIRHPPRIGETRPIAALMPHVLAQYGLADAARESAGSLDALV